MDDNNMCRTNAVVLHITDLPDGILVSIANCLAKPSVALFAMAMSVDSNQQTQTSKAIISSTNLSVLDFSDIEKSLAVKLSDGDIDKILRIIDAVNNLKILKLVGCVSITGIGLNELRSSIVIQQIDMSLVGKHESASLKPEPLLSESVVIPILEDIISNGSSLKQLELPKKWRNSEVESTLLDQFLERYNQYMTNQNYCCSNCNRTCAETGGMRWMDLERDDFYGIQNYTCFGCLNHFCYDCRSSDWCYKCEKEYCKNCVTMNRCVICEDYTCPKCRETRSCEGGCGEVLCECCFEKNTCSFCGKMRCIECVISYHCERDGCGKTVCIDCVHSNDEGGECDACGVEICSSDCRHHIQESRKAKGEAACLDCALEGTSLH